MSTKKFSTLIGAGVVAAAMGAVAQPADAFVITNTSASWDNVTLTTGDLVGSAGVLPDADNLVKFLDADGVSQVRWGAAVYGEEVGTGTYRWATKEEKKAGLAQKYTYYTSKTDKKGRTKKKKRTGWIVENTKVVSSYKNQSGLGYKGVSNLDLEVGEIFNLGELTHFNQTIWGNKPIGESADFSLNLDFGDSGIGSQTFNFAFSVDETPNKQEVCPYQTDANKGCSDKISWDFAIDQKNSFTYEDEEYSLELVGFGNELASRGIINEFISQEGRDNSANLFARLVKVDTTKDIPEPTALLGLAGMALYFARSRKQQSEGGSEEMA